MARLNCGRAECGLGDGDNMELSKRLNAVASLVTDGYRLADIGTDHAYIPIFLVSTGKIPAAVAMDVNRGPLLRAEENIRAHGLQDKITTRISDGFAALEENEADAAVIAGMGGPLTIRILKEGKDIVRSLKECILQPQSEIEKVRAFLLEEGFFFLREDMVEEDGKYYPMMKVLPPGDGRGAGCERNGKEPDRKEPDGRGNGAQGSGVQGWNDTELRYGKLLLEEKNPVLREYLQREIRIRAQILDRLKGRDSADVQRRKTELEKELKIAEKGMDHYAV